MEYGFLPVEFEEYLGLLVEVRTQDYRWNVLILSDFDLGCFSRVRSSFRGFTPIDCKVQFSRDEGNTIGLLFGW